MGLQNRKLGRRAVTCCLLDMHDYCTKTHSSYGSLYKIKPDNTLGWIAAGLVSDVQPVAEELLEADGHHQERESNFSLWYGQW